MTLPHSIIEGPRPSVQELTGTRRPHDGARGRCGPLTIGGIPRPSNAVAAGAHACVPAAKKETSCKRRQAPLLYRAILGVQARPLGRGQPFLERPLDLGQALQERLLDLIQSLL